MNERFSVGEVAIYWREASQFHRMECTISEPLEWRTWRCIETGEMGRTLSYAVDFPSNPLTQNWRGRWIAEPHELRKKRPPQDWQRLCNLTDAPREVECA